MKDLGRPYLGSVDWRFATLLLSATICMALRVAIEHDQIRVFGREALPFFSAGVLVAYLVVPLLLCAPLRCEPARFLGVGDSRAAVMPFLLFLGLILVANSYLALQPGFITYYGSFQSESWATLALGTLLTMIGVEFFFRGFLLFPLASRYGWCAIPIVTMPYCLIHIGKPVEELFGSILVGAGFGYLALRSGSIHYGIVLHWILAMWLFVVPYAWKCWREVAT